MWDSYLLRSAGATFCALAITSISACGSSDGSSRRDPRIDGVSLSINPEEATVQVGASATYMIDEVTVTIDDGDPQTFDVDDLDALEDNEDLTPEERDAIIATLSTLEWTTEEEDVATIDKDGAGQHPVSISGTATGVEPGQTIVTAELFDEEGDTLANASATLIVVLSDEGSRDGGADGAEAGMAPEAGPDPVEAGAPEIEAGLGADEEAGTSIEAGVVEAGAGDAGDDVDPQADEAGVDQQNPSEEAGSDVTTGGLDPCESNPCLNGGECASQTGQSTYSCTCSAGFVGIDCESPDPCVPNPCDNDGECITISASEYSCECPPGFEGEFCEDDIDECDPNPCENGGECIDGVADYECDCPPGYDGDDCEKDIDDCDPNPCLNGGECIDGVDEFTCNCLPGYEGDGCEDDVDDCDPDPCVEGECIDEVDGFDCDCPPNRTGPTCETVVTNCVPDPCNGQACEDVDGEYECTCTFPFIGEGCDKCAVGYGGPNCVPVCQSHACQNGTCIVNGNSYRCGCQEGWAGTLCDQCAPGWVLQTYDERVTRERITPAGIQQQPEPECVPVFSDVAAGLAHYCAVQQVTGALICDGDDTWGEVSDAPNGAFIDVSAGADHSCAINQSGAIECWGRDYTQFPEEQITPQQVAFIDIPTNGPYVQINSGTEHACAIRQSGVVDCWGKLTTQPQPPQWCPNDGPAEEAGFTVAGGPQQEPPVPPRDHLFRDIAAGYQFTCGTVVESSDSPYAGQVICWGNLPQRGVPDYRGEEDCNDLNGNSVATRLVPQGDFSAVGDLGAGHVQRCYSEEGTSNVACAGCTTSDPRTVSPGFEGGVIEQLSGGYLNTCYLFTNGDFECQGLVDVDRRNVGGVMAMSTGGCFAALVRDDGSLMTPSWGGGDWRDSQCVSDYIPWSCQYGEAMRSESLPLD